MKTGVELTFDMCCQTCLRQWTNHLMTGLDSADETLWLFNAPQTMGIVKNKSGIKNERSLDSCIQYIFLWWKWLCKISLPTQNEQSAGRSPITVVEVQIAALNNSYFWHCYLLEGYKKRDILILGIGIFLSPWISMCYHSDTKHKNFSIPSITWGLPWRWRQHIPTKRWYLSTKLHTRRHIKATGIECEISHCSSSVSFWAESGIILSIVENQSYSGNFKD
jgi:hypothetical protein